DMFIVKGVNVFPLAVQDVVCGFRPELTGEFQILLNDSPVVTNPKVRVECGPGVTPVDHPDLRERLARRIREVLVFTPDVELLPAGSMPRTEKKAKRLYRLYQGERP